MRIVEFGNNELHNVWLFLKDMLFHPLDASIYVNKDKVDTVLPHIKPVSVSPLETSLIETFNQFISIYCKDDALKISNSFLMEGRIWRLFDEVINAIERDEKMNNVEMLQDNLFKKELEYVNLQLAKDPCNDFIVPEGKKLHYGVAFFVSDKERLLIVKDYLEERINGFTE